MDSEGNCVADMESDMVQDSRIKDTESPEQRDVSVAPNVPGLIQPTWKSERHDEKVLLMFNVMQTRRNKGVKKQ
jgi:hypothetical protein